MTMPRELVERELGTEGPRRARADGRISRRRRSVTVNLGESPLGWLHAHGHLDDRLFAAGEALRSDYERAQMAPSITMRWDPVRAKTTGERGLEASERQIAARRRFGEAMQAAGRGLEDILWRVVCAGETIAVAEKSLEWPARSGKLVLRLALDRVAEFYRVR